MLIFSKASRLYCRWSASNYLSGLSIGCNAWLRTRHYRAIGFGTLRVQRSDWAQLCPSVLCCFPAEKSCQPGCKKMTVPSQLGECEITRCLLRDHEMSREISRCHGMSRHVTALSRHYLGLFSACSQHVLGMSRHDLGIYLGMSRHRLGMSRHYLGMSRHYLGLQRPLTARMSFAHPF